MSRTADRLARIQQQLRARRRLIQVWLSDFDGGVVPGPPLLIGGTKKSRAEALKKWQAAEELRAAASGPVTQPDVKGPLTGSAADDVSPASASATESRSSRWTRCTRCHTAIELPYGQRAACSSCGADNQ